MSDERRRRLESVIPEIIKRAVEIGMEKAVEAPDNLKEFVGGIKLPREVASYVFSQVEETKNGIFRVVAKEIRDFLDSANLSTEMQRILTTLQFEINTTIRFKPNDSSATGADEATGEGEGDRSDPNAPPAARTMPKPEVKSDVRIKRDDRPPRKRNRD